MKHKQRERERGWRERQGGREDVRHNERGRQTDKQTDRGTGIAKDRVINIGR